MILALEREREREKASKPEKINESVNFPALSRLGFG